MKKIVYESITASLASASGRHTNFVGATSSRDYVPQSMNKTREEAIKISGEMFMLFH